jgi:hypothetical protein
MHPRPPLDKSRQGSGNNNASSAPQVPNQSNRIQKMVVPLIRKQEQTIGIAQNIVFRNNET